MKNLFDLYFMIRDVSGWLSRCADAGFEKEELVYLERLSDEYCSYQPEIEAYQWYQQVVKNGGPYIELETSDDIRMTLISSRIEKEYLEIDAQLAQGVAYAQARIGFDRVKGMEKLRRSIRARMVHRDEPDAMKVTEHEIVRAREHKLEDWLNIKAGKRIQCPYHDDKHPSFLVKTFGYCMSCGSWADTIKWLQTVEGYTFKDAIKKLQ